jgi:hypothetical protein
MVGRLAVRQYLRRAPTQKSFKLKVWGSTRVPRVMFGVPPNILGHRHPSRRPKIQIFLPRTFGTNYLLMR